MCLVDLPSNSMLQSIGEKSIMDENKYFKDGMRERGGKETITHFKNFVCPYKMYDFFLTQWSDTRFRFIVLYKIRAKLKK